MNWKKHYTTLAPLKVGDTVTIKHLLEISSEWPTVNSDMVELHGNIYTIKEIKTMDAHGTFYILANSQWHWTEWMFEN